MHPALNFVTVYNGLGFLVKIVLLSIDNLCSSPYSLIDIYLFSAAFLPVSLVELGCFNRSISIYPMFIIKGQTFLETEKNWVLMGL